MRVRTLAVLLLLSGAASAQVAARGGRQTIGNDLSQLLVTPNASGAVADTLSNLTRYLATGTGAVSRTLGSKLGDVVSVKDFGAVGDGVTDDTAAIQTAINGNTSAVVMFVSGLTYKTTGTLSLPVLSNGRFKLWMDGATISYGGSGYALDANGSGNAKVNLLIHGGRVIGTSAGLAGLHLQAFNMARVEGASFEGFTTGSGILNEGANTITLVDVQAVGNKYGLRNVGKVVASVNYSANAVKMLGGQLVSNLTWGAFEDGSLSGTVGPNENNTYTGVVFEDNRTNGQTSGQAFVQRCDACGFYNNYFEYATGSTVANQLVLGDATYTARSTIVRGNIFLSVGASAAISNARAQTTVVDGNLEAASTANFFLQGSASTNTQVGYNNTLAVTTPFAGVDSGDTVWWGPGSNLQNAWAPSVRGWSFNSIVGLDQDLKVRLRSTGSNFVSFETDSGQVASVSSLGAFRSNGVTFASLGAPANGTLIYCSDCTIANPCAGAGTGALAKRLNGVWVCN